MSNAHSFILLVSFICVAVIDGQSQTKATSGISFYVGTYTQGESEGIYEYQLLPDGRLEKLRLAAKSENPSYLAKSADGKFLLAVNEVQDQANSGGRVSSFARTPQGLTFLQSMPSGGASPCYVSINSKGYVLTANYTSGTIGLLKLSKDGKLEGPLDVMQHVGKGAHPRQDRPHAHGVWFQRTGGIVSIDLGTNDLWFSTLDYGKQKLMPSPTPKLAMATGAGPRHLAFHTNGKWIYVINELNSTVSQLTQENKTGQYAIQQSWNTLPTDYKGENLCADIHISGDGRFLYASNRGHNTLAIFSINKKDGSLQLIGNEPVRGNWPRNFALSPDESYLVVANQRTNNLVSYQRNKQTGMLTFVHEVAAPTPVCIVF